MTSGMSFEFDARNHTVVVLLVLRATLLATCKGATFEVVTARCQNCSPKLCLPFGANGPRPLQQMQLTKKYIQLWDGYQPALSKKNPN